MVVTRISIILILAAALAGAGGCAKKAEEVIEVPACECEKPCPDCACEKEGKAAAPAGTVAGPSCPEKSGPN